jgi:alpha-L-fucosidase
MRRHGRSIYGCTQAPPEYPQPEDCRLTWNPQTRRLYVHVLAWPFKDLYLDGLAGKVQYAQLLNDASELKMTEPADDYAKQHQTLTLSLPTIKPDVAVPVIELFMA